jgi:hypothetical protein
MSPLGGVERLSRPDDSFDLVPRSTMLHDGLIVPTALADARRSSDWSHWSRVIHLPLIARIRRRG